MPFDYSAVLRRFGRDYKPLPLWSLFLLLVPTLAATILSIHNFFAGVSINSSSNRRRHIVTDLNLPSEFNSGNGHGEKLFSVDSTGWLVILAVLLAVLAVQLIFIIRRFGKLQSIEPIRVTTIILMGIAVAGAISFILDLIYCISGMPYRNFLNPTTVSNVGGYFRTFLFSAVSALLPLFILHKINNRRNLSQEAPPIA